MLLSLTLLSAVIDLVSFSGILYTIYPPLFGALIAYAATGTAISVALGKVRAGAAPAGLMLRCSAARCSALLWGHAMP